MGENEYIKHNVMRQLRACSYALGQKNTSPKSIIQWCNLTHFLMLFGKSMLPQCITKWCSLTHDHMLLGQLFFRKAGYTFQSKNIWTSNLKSPSHMHCGCIIFLPKYIQTGNFKSPARMYCGLNLVADCYAS